MVEAVVSALFTTPFSEHNMGEAQEIFVGWTKDSRKKKNIHGCICKGVGEEIEGISPLRDKNPIIKILEHQRLKRPQRPSDNPLFDLQKRNLREGVTGQGWVWGGRGGNCRVRQSHGEQWTFSVDKASKISKDNIPSGCDGGTLQVACFPGLPGSSGARLLTVTTRWRQPTRQWREPELAGSPSGWVLSELLPQIWHSINPAALAVPRWHNIWASRNRLLQQRTCSRTRERVREALANTASSPSCQPPRGIRLSALHHPSPEGGLCPGWHLLILLAQVRRNGWHWSHWILWQSHHPELADACPVAGGSSVAGLTGPFGATWPHLGSCSYPGVGQLDARGCSRPPLSLTLQAYPTEMIQPLSSIRES